MGVLGAVVHARPHTTVPRAFSRCIVYKKMSAKKKTAALAIPESAVAMAICRDKRCPGEKIRMDAAAAKVKKQISVAIVAMMTKKIDRKTFDDRMQRILAASKKTGLAETCTLKKCNGELLLLIRDMLAMIKGLCKSVPDKAQREKMCAEVERLRESLESTKTLTASDRAKVIGLMMDVGMAKAKL